MYSQAIVTKYSTGKWGNPRMIVKATACRKVYAYDYDLDSEVNHQKAAERFAYVLGWMIGDRVLTGGVLPNGDYVWVISGSI